MNTRAYIDWKNAVLKRDKRTCRMPGCGKKMKAMHVHHIRRWEDFPTLRFVVTNGITLCRKCHQNIWSKEEQYESLFHSIINSITEHSLLILLDRFRHSEENGDG